MADSDSTPGKSPAFQFYPKDFLSDSNVVGMSMQERGVYITLICLCWQDGTIPSDVAQLARKCSTPVRSFQRIWPAVEKCFRKAGASRLVHPRLERERQKQEDYRRRQSDASRKRWDKPEPSHRIPKPGTPVAVPKASSAICDLRSASSSSDLRQQKAATDPNARSKRPIYTSDRFAVFEWQLDDLGKMLGPHLEAFDLHAFFDALSQQSRESGLVIPRPETWAWLQAQVLAEAKRRNLPIASAEPIRDRAAEEKAQNERILALIQQDPRHARR